ncbi:hypothetical protein H8E06_00070 [bacterium]|nr:hypothetical protein [bacterium]
MKPPSIYHATVSFEQEGNTMGTTETDERITIDLEYQLGEEEGSFIVLRTAGWSIDSASDLESLINRVKRLEERK